MKVLIVNDFFKRRKEAVSNQMEYLLGATGGKIITATRFMKQKALQKEDIKDKIYVFPPFFYHIVLFFQVLFGEDDIHVFEEEPNKYKEKIFNFSKKNIYVSMYRSPFPEYAEHLKKYKKLKGVFVELEAHKELLIKYGINKDLIHVSPTPAKLPRKKNTKKLNFKNINLLFASWNNAEGDPLPERGLVYLVDLLVKNPNFTLTILLRDDKTKAFIDLINERKVANRVKLIDIYEKDLGLMFDKSDFVVYVIQKTLTKDVPNSLIDGLSRGKPVILTTIFGLSKIVENEKVGYVIKPGTKAKKMEVNEDEYKKISDRAFELSKRFTKEKYINAIIENYDKWL